MLNMSNKFPTIHRLKSRNKIPEKKSSKENIISEEGNQLSRSPYGIVTQFT